PPTGPARPPPAPPGSAARGRRYALPPAQRPRAPVRPSWHRARRTSLGSSYLSPFPFPSSFYFSSPPFTRSSPTVSPRVFTVGRASSGGGSGLKPSSASTAAMASAAAIV